MLVGNLTAILVSAGVTFAYGLWRPDDYDWWAAYYLIVCALSHNWIQDSLNHNPTQYRSIG